MQMYKKRLPGEGVVNGGVATGGPGKVTYRPYSKGALDLALLFSFLTRTM